MDAAPAQPADRGILDVVLALHRSPALRFDLRERPLPADLDLILRLAAPSQPLLDETANQHDVTPATLREAARFYLQQVLFEPGTDAYRILGVAPGAAFERIREHHQWLQRWLHPDRIGDDGFAAFAAKLNWAWQQLRNERKRNAYDVERAQAADLSPEHAGQLAPARTAKWTTVPVSPSRRPGRWWRRGALGVAFGSCLVLFVLALTRGGPPSATPADTDTQASAPAASTVATTVQTPVTPQPARHAESAADRASAAPRPRPAATAHVAVAAPRNVERMRRVHRAATTASADTLPVPPRLRAAVVVAPVSAPPPRIATQPADASHAPQAVALATVQPVASASVPEVPAPAIAPELLVHRVDLARQRANLLVAYFRSADNAVPDWRHAPAPYNAPLQRAALRQRNGLPDSSSFALDNPVWRMSEDHIAMDADYRVQRNRAVIEHGRFRLRMVWQDNAWQVTHIQLEPQG